MVSRLDKFRMSAVSERPCDVATRCSTNHLTFVAATSLDWLRCAARLPGRALHVAIALKLQSDIGRSRQFRSQRALIESFGVDRYAERRALRALSTAGLIRVEQGRGRRPVVTVIGANPDDTRSGGHASAANTEELA